MNNLLQNINSFLPAEIQKIGQIADASIIFRLNNSDNVKYLYFSPCSEIRAVSFSDNSPKREYENAGWLGPYLHKLLDSKLVKIEKSENIFSLFFNNNLTCDIHFFGGTGNAILLDENRKVAAAMHPGRFFKTGNDYDFSKNISHSNQKIIFIEADKLIEKLNILELNSLRKKVEQFLANEKKRLLRRLKKIQIELDDSKHFEVYKQKGELLKANYHLLKRGMKSVKLINYFSPENEKIEIELEPAKNPQENIAKYFKKAKKLERGRKQILNRIDVTNAELEAIDKKCHLQSTIFDVCELKKLLPKKKKKQSTKNVNCNQQKMSIAKIKYFISSDNFDILVGKNAKENDYLTVRLANGNDMWLHTRNRPGAHVVIRAQRAKDFPKNTLIEAARIFLKQKMIPSKILLIL